MLFLFSCKFKSASLVFTPPPPPPLRAHIRHINAYIPKYSFKKKLPARIL